LAPRARGPFRLHCSRTRCRAGGNRRNLASGRARRQATGLAFELLTAPMSPTAHHSASDALLALVRAHPGERMTIQDLMDGLGERSFGFALLLFGLLSAIALIPGLATITSVPLLFFGLQMFVGYRTPWLPAMIAKREIGRRDLEKTLERGKPIMQWIE